MQFWKKLGKALLFPHVAVIFLLVAIATAFLTCTFIFTGGATTPISVCSYVLAFYALLIVCLRIPDIIRFFQRFKQENKYIRRLQSDVRLRIKLSLCGALLWNVAYAVFQLGLGFYHRSVWFYALSGYYLCLAIMRLFLALHARRYHGGEARRLELQKYRVCGYVLLCLNVALSVIVFFMVYWNRTFQHHQITTIALAAYTFTSLTFAIINIVKYRKYDSPVYSAAKAVSLVAALVSMLTLETTMLTAFGAAASALFKRTILAVSGGAICLFVLAAAVYIIVKSHRELNALNQERTEK